MKVTKIVKRSSALGRNKVIFNLNNELFCGTLRGIVNNKAVIGCRSFKEAIELPFVLESNTTDLSIKNNSVVILNANSSKFIELSREVSSLQTVYCFEPNAKGLKLK